MNDVQDMDVFGFIKRERASAETTYPTWSVDTAPYWMACAKGMLLYQVCDDCSSSVFHPRAACPYCLGSRLTWRQSAGTGEIYSYSVQHVPIDRARPHPPRALGVIHMDEDWYMFSEIVCDDPYCLRIGQKVSVHFDEVADDLVLPKFRPDATGAAEGTSNEL